jgi:hypothetical protein
VSKLIARRAPSILIPSVQTVNALISRLTRQAEPSFIRSSRHTSIQLAIYWPHGVHRLDSATAKARSVFFGELVKRFSLRIHFDQTAAWNLSSMHWSRSKRTLGAGLSDLATKSVRLMAYYEYHYHSPEAVACIGTNPAKISSRRSAMRGQA